MIETGISFGSIHSFYDLNLILSGSEIPPAKPKTTYVDIPGGDGSVDLTEANGEVKYYDRDCKFIFTMNPSDDLSDRAFEAKKTEVSNLLNGKVFEIILDKDEEFYYSGRCEVNEYLSDKRIRQIVVTAKVKPYKYRTVSTVKWIENITSEPQTVIFRNSRMSVVPTIVCGHDATVEFKGVTYELTSGMHKLPNIQFVEGDNELVVADASGESDSSVLVFYREGEL